MSTRLLCLFLIHILSLLSLSNTFAPAIDYGIRTSSHSKCLRYKDKDDYDEHNSQRSFTNNDRLTIPLLGPIPRAPPLIIGAEMRINQPTPLQWRSLEESVITYMERNRDNDSTTIDGAPIVAIIDDVTGKEQQQAGRLSGRYATLAAVTGVTSQSETGNYGADESFISSMKNPEMFLDGSVRLVGIGRAVLGKIYYQVPSKIEEGNDEYNDDEYDDFDETTMPIIMAEFKLLHDTGVRSDDEWNVGKRSREMSPVAALNRLNSEANKAEWIHSERRKLISGLTAGKARLTNFKLRQTEELEDYDGLGMLAGFDDAECDTEACDEMNMAMSDIFTALNDEIMRDETQRNVQEGESSASEILSNKINYGLTYASGFSSLADLTREALEVLDPYYSPPFKEREEYWYEIFGFVAWRALEAFVEPKDMAWALKCKSSTERLERATTLLMEHRLLLQDLAAEVNEELKDCGEECTDLW